MHCDLLVTANGERADGVAGLACETLSMCNWDTWAVYPL
jgi:hypothetical protein